MHHLIRFDFAELRCDKILDLYCTLRFYVRMGTIGQLQSAVMSKFPDVDKSLQSPYELVGIPRDSFEIFMSEQNGVVDRIEEDTKRRFPCGKAGCVGVWTCDDGKCRSCDTSYCSDCLEPKAADHVCDPANKASALEVRISTKACPRCTAPVHRREGCPQMMCVVCHCMFNYDTGALITKRDALHNPHYMALSPAARAAVQKQVATIADDQASSADATDNDLRCMTTDDFHLQVRNRCETPSALKMADSSNRYKLYNLEYEFSLLQTKTNANLALTMDKEILDRVARVAFLHGKGFPTFKPTVSAPRKLVIRSFCTRTSLIGPEGDVFKKFEPFETVTDFGKADFIRAATYSLSGRLRRAQNAARNQSVCDAARDMIVTYVSSRDVSVRACILKALETLAVDTKKGAAREARAAAAEGGGE